MLQLQSSAQQPFTPTPSSPNVRVTIRERLLGIRNLVQQANELAQQIQEHLHAIDVAPTAGQSAPGPYPIEAGVELLEVGMTDLLKRLLSIDAFL